MLLATAVGAGITTILVLYFCSQKKENQQKTATSTKENKGRNKTTAKVSIVQPYKQQHTEPHNKSDNTRSTMGNSQSDDIADGCENSPNANNGDNRPAVSNVSYTSGSEGKADKCCVNSESNQKSTGDKNSSNYGISSVDHKASNLTKRNKQSSDVIPNVNKDKTGIHNQHCNVSGGGGVTADVDITDGVSQDGGVKSNRKSNISYNESIMQKEVRSDVNKEVVGSCLSGESVVGEFHCGSSISSDKTDTLGLAEGSYCAQENQDNNNTSFSTKVGSHKRSTNIVVVGDNNGLKSFSNSKEPGSSSTLDGNSTRDSHNMNLGGDLNDKGTAENIHGSFYKDPKDTLNSEGKNIDSPSLCGNDNDSLRCEKDKSPGSFQGQINEKMPLKKESVSSCKSVDSGDSFQSIESGHLSEGMDQPTIDTLSKVPMRSKNKSANKRDAFILPEADSALTKDMIGQWISDKRTMIAEQSRADVDNEAVRSPGNVFCCQINNDCKVIFSPNLSQDEGNVITTCSDDPVKMTEKACQTNPGGRASGQGYGNDDATTRDQLHDALLQLKELREENQKLQQVLQTQEKSGISQLKEENNNTKSLPMKEKLISSSGRQKVVKDTEEIVISLGHVQKHLPGDQSENAQQNLSGNKVIIEDTAKDTCQNKSVVEAFETGLTAQTSEKVTADQPTAQVNTEEVHVASLSDKHVVVESEPQINIGHQVNTGTKCVLPNAEDRTKLVRQRDGNTKSFKKRESSFFDDLVVPDSPCGATTEGSGGFSFDDVLKANLEYLSDDDPFGQDYLFQSSKDMKKVDQNMKETAEVNNRSEAPFIDDSTEIQSKEESENSSEDANNEGSENKEDGTEMFSGSNDKNDRTEKVGKAPGSLCTVSNSAKFWETKLTAIHRDKTVAGSGENLDIDSNSIENIQKTKLLWEEKETSSPQSEEGDVRPSEFNDDRLTASIRQTKMKWEERMTEQDSGSNSSRRRSLEDLSNMSNGGSDLEESLGSASKMLQKKLLWEGLNISPNSSFRGDSPSKRMTLDLESEMDKNDVSKTKLKWEEMLDKDKDSPEPVRKKVQLVSKSDFELELEVLSTDVIVPSIADVSNTKSKFEKLFGSSEDIKCQSPERIRRNERRSRSPRDCTTNPMFSSLKEKFEKSKIEEPSAISKYSVSMGDVRKGVVKNSQSVSQKASFHSCGDSINKLTKDEDPFLSLTNEGSLVEDGKSMVQKEEQYKIDAERDDAVQAEDMKDTENLCKANDSIERNGGALCKDKVEDNGNKTIHASMTVDQSMAESVSPKVELHIVEDNNNQQTDKASVANDQNEEELICDTNQDIDVTVHHKTNDCHKNTTVTSEEVAGKNDDFEETDTRESIPSVTSDLEVGQNAAESDAGTYVGSHNNQGKEDHETCFKTGSNTDNTLTGESHVDAIDICDTKSGEAPGLDNELSIGNGAMQPETENQNEEGVSANSRLAEGSNSTEQNVIKAKEGEDLHVIRAESSNIEQHESPIEDKDTDDAGNSFFKEAINTEQKECKIEDNETQDSDKPASICINDNLDFENEVETSKGSSESFCDSELEFVKNSKGVDDKVELATGGLLGENTSDC